MSEVVDPPVTTTEPPPPAPATPAAPAAPAAPSAPAVQVTTKTTEPAPPAPAAAPDWRAAAVTQVFGEAKDTDTAEVKAEREKLERLASRFNTHGDVLKALRDAQTKITAGLKPMTVDAKSTPEQIAEYRKAAGIPEKPEEYDLGLKEGVVLSEGDKALVNSWVTRVHGANATPAQVQAGVAALLEVRDQQALNIAKGDETHRAEIDASLREEWGNHDYVKNVDAVKSMLGQAGEDVRDTILNARDASGRAIANNPGVIRWLAQHARELGWVGATVTPTGGDLGAAVSSELDNLKAEMRKDPIAWRKNVKGQKRFMELTEQQARLEAKAKK